MNRRGFLLSTIAALVAPALPAPPKMFWDLGADDFTTVSVSYSGSAAGRLTFAALVRAKGIAERHAMKPQMIDGSECYVLDVAKGAQIEYFEATYASDSSIELEISNFSVEPCDNPTIDPDAREL